MFWILPNIRGHYPHIYGFSHILKTFGTGQNFDQVQHRDFAEVRDIAGVVPLLLHPSRFLQGGESTKRDNHIIILLK